MLIGYRFISYEMFKGVMINSFCSYHINQDGSKRIVKRNPFVTPAVNILKTRQNQRGHVKRIACDTNIPLSSKESVLGLLQNFADQFLDVGYNGRWSAQSFYGIS